MPLAVFLIVAWIQIDPAARFIEVLYGSSCLVKKLRENSVPISIYILASVALAMDAKRSILLAPLAMHRRQRMFESSA